MFLLLDSKERGKCGMDSLGWTGLSMCVCSCVGIYERNLMLKVFNQYVMEIGVCVCVCVCVCVGYGLHCHRAIITLCKLIGVQDLYAKAEGSVNLLNITRALFNGLANQV